MRPIQVRTVYTNGDVLVSYRHGNKRVSTAFTRWPEDTDVKGYTHKGYVCLLAMVPATSAVALLILRDGKTVGVVRCVEHLDEELGPLGLAQPGRDIATKLFALTDPD